MPGATIRVLSPERVGEGEVRLAPGARGSRRIDRRANQRVAERQLAATGLDEARQLSLVERRGAPAAGAGDRRQIAGVAGRGDQQCLPGLRRERSRSREKGPFDALPHRERIVERFGAGALGLAEHRGNLDQGKRVARGSGDQPTCDSGGNRPAVRAGEQQLACRRCAQPLDPQVSDGLRVEAGRLSLAHREQEGNRLSL